MINDLKTVSEINAEISRLQRRAETIKRKTRQNVLADIVRTMRDNDLTIDEIAQAFRSPSVKPSAPPTVKYKHPSGATWSGRGRTPGWVKAVEAAGESRDLYLIPTPATNPQ
ncbi:H-NS histone family protein [Alcaligenes faecalis]|uniref:H-NS histone family protein n=1 Tax=Alcaligenes faecalis TaxID=511 RepID=UPI000F65D0EB|nr:H-NS histone family protein [Alcaligenes faecalis]RSE63632.1 H-NS histone family protein [Alcaligenes faecalis]